MSSRADEALLAALGAVAGAFRELGVPAMIIGGVAVIARGVPRQTIDVDGTVWAEALDLDRLFDALRGHGLVPRIADARDFARQRQVLLLRHEASGTPVEVSLAWLPFEREALERATVEDIAGVSVPVASAEDLIIYKTVAWRDRDRSDVERLLVLYGSEVDLDRIRSIVGEIASVLDEPGRLAEFEAIVRRVREATGEAPT
jgi:Nucleotidyltransferase of unknown function (DUF6036)